MATTKPRINMAIRPQTYDVITRLAKLQRRSRSSVVVELLEQAIPILERVVVVGEAAQHAQVAARKQLGDALEKAEAAVLPHVTAAMDQLDMLLPAPEGSSGPPNGGLARAASVASRRANPSRSPTRARSADPRPVTRGSTRGRGKGKKRARKSAKSQ